MARTSSGSFQCLGPLLGPSQVEGLLALSITAQYTMPVTMGEDGLVHPVPGRVLRSGRDTETVSTR